MSNTKNFKENSHREFRKLSQWFLNWFHGHSHTTATPDKPFNQYRWRTAQKQELLAELETYLERSGLRIDLFERFPNIDLLARHLVDNEPIAIIGMSCRFPGVEDLDDYWSLLKEGRHGITDASDRWDMNHFYDPDRDAPGKMVNRKAGFLKNVEYFDADFFGFNALEAPHLDPRQRIMLELAWEALEDAGIPSDTIAGSKAGVYMATLTENYTEMLFGDLNRVSGYSAPGVADSIVSNRISYCFDLQGPSLSLDTACSGSLVAIEFALQALRNGDIPMALVGGIMLNLIPDFTIFFSKAGALSSTGFCKTFDHKADGIVRSDGAGLIVLKRLSEAVADGDQIYAVIRGGAVNNDGKTHGIMRPSGEAQAEMLRDAYLRSDVDPTQVQFIEAHGTGTKVGDPIEVKALGSVLAPNREQGAYCAIGSVKTNLGHMESAAGVGGLIKTALAMTHRRIPATLHFEKPNPEVPWDDFQIRVQDQFGPWPDEKKPLIAGISSFGFGGTNAHTVLEQGPPPKPVAEQPFSLRRFQLCALSAQDEEALYNRVRQHRDYLVTEKPKLYDFCYSLNAKRAHLEHRVAFVARTLQELEEKMTSFLEGKAEKGLIRHEGPILIRPRPVFVFSGQGSHWLGMGRNLYETEPLFRKTLEACDQALAQLSDVSLIREMFADEANAHLDSTDLAQPAIYAAQVALAALWRSWGVEPAAIVGHSLGEIAAAHVAGVLTLEEGMLIVFHRGRLMKTTEGQGRTAMVERAGEELDKALLPYAGRVSAAGSNSPGATLLAGDPEPLQELLTSFEKQGVFCRMLAGVTIAFHSVQMEPLKDELLSSIATIQPRVEKVPLYSTVTGKRIAGKEQTPAYWADNLREPFRFTEVCQTLTDDGFNLFLEVSAHPVLAVSIGQCLNSFGVTGAAVPSLRRNEPDDLQIFSSLGMLYNTGYAFNWSKLYPSGERVKLPVYPWNRKRFWYDQVGENEEGINSKVLMGIIKSSASSSSEHPLLGRHFQPAATTGEHYWETSLSASRPFYLKDHKVRGSVVMPGAGYLEMVLAATHHLFGNTPACLEQVLFKKALFLSEKQGSSMQIAFTPQAKDRFRFRIFSEDARGQGHDLHIEGMVGKTNEAEFSGAVLTEVQAGCSGELDFSDQLDFMAGRGLNYGPLFQAIDRIRVGDHQCLVHIQVPEKASSDIDRYRLHPILMDAALQAIDISFHVLRGDLDATELYLPVGIESLSVLEPVGNSAWCRVSFAPKADLYANEVSANLEFFDESGRLLAVCSGASARRLENASGEAPIRDRLYKVDWCPTPPEQASDAVVEPGSWLVFANRGSVSKALVDLLQEADQKVTTLYASHAFREVGPKSFEIDPGSKQDFTRVAKILGEGQTKRAGIVYLWGLEAAEPDASRTIEGASGSGCGPIMHMVQALAGHPDFKQPPRFWLVTQATQQVAQEPVHLSASAALWGYGRVIGSEHPEMWGGLIDLEGDAQHSKETSHQDARLIFEQMVRPKRESQVAIRNGQLYGPRMRLLKKDETTGTPMSFRPGGAYLITGGFGGLGLAAAKWMAERGASHLILVGRSPVPDRSTWQDLKEPNTYVQAILELEALGASVQVATLDISIKSQLDDFLEHYSKENRPPIRGVLHCAGIIEDRLIIRMETSSLGRVMNPKCLGVMNLHHCLANEELDFFVLYSSISSLIGLPGQSNYAAGNAFMDSMAAHRRSLGLPGLSINWGPWAEVGMAVQESLPELHLEQGLQSLKVDEGLTDLGTLLQTNLSQAADIAMNWNKWGETASSPLYNHLVVPEEEAPGSELRHSFATSLLQIEDSTKRAHVAEARLRELIAAALHLDEAKLDREKPLNIMGLDSIMATDVSNRVKKQLDMSISVIEFLSGSNLIHLTEKILNQLPNEEQDQVPVQETPLLPVPRDGGPLPLSFEQERLWIMDRMVTEKHLYNQCGSLRFRGRLDIEVMRASIGYIFARHESMRTYFGMDGDTPVQIIRDQVDVDVPFVDLSHHPGEEQEKAMAELDHHDQHYCFDLSQTPLYYFRIVKTSDDTFFLMGNSHHIISDQWSARVLFSDLNHIYSALIDGKEPHLPELTVQYPDYAVWSRNQLSGLRWENLLHYWEDQLRDIPTTMNLPYSTALAQSNYAGALVRETLDPKLLANLQKLTETHAITLYGIMLTVFKLLLSYYSETRDVVIGTEVAERDTPELSDMIGFLVNQLVLRTDFSGNPTGHELLERVSETVEGAFQHKAMPFNKLVEHLKIVPKAGTTPIFQTLFLFQVNLFELDRLSDLEMELVDRRNGTVSQYHLLLRVSPIKNSLVMTLEYQIDLFKQETVEEMLKGYLSLLHALAEQPDSTYEDLTEKLEESISEFRHERRKQRQAGRISRLKRSRKR